MVVYLNLFYCCQVREHVDINTSVRFSIICHFTGIYHCVASFLPSFPNLKKVHGRSSFRLFSLGMLLKYTNHRAFQNMDNSIQWKTGHVYTIFNHFKVKVNARIALICKKNIVFSTLKNSEIFFLIAILIFFQKADLIKTSLV